MSDDGLKLIGKRFFTLVSAIRNQMYDFTISICLIYVVEILKFPFDWVNVLSIV
jgi:hypothetical protein